MTRRFNTADNYQYSNFRSDNHPFIEPMGLNMVKCRGRVVEIEHHEVFRSRFHKIINSVICGEPYQFAHQTAEYLVRIEEPTRNGIGHTLDFFLYGNYIGRIYAGDEIEIIARNDGRRYIAEKVYNHSTNCRVRPGLQIPAIIIRCLFLLAIIMLIGIGLSLYGMARTGMLSNLVAYGILIIVAITWVKSWIRSNRWRR